MSLLCCAIVCCVVLLLSMLFVCCAFAVLLLCCAIVVLLLFCAIAAYCHRWLLLIGPVDGDISTTLKNRKTTTNQWKNSKNNHLTLV